MRLKPGTTSANVSERPPGGSPRHQSGPCVRVSGLGCGV